MEAQGSKAQNYAQAQSGPIGQMASGSLVGSVRTGLNRTQHLKRGFKRFSGDVATGDSCSSEIFFRKHSAMPQIDDFFNHFYPKRFWFFGFCVLAFAGSCAYLMH